MLKYIIRLVPILILLLLLILICTTSYAGTLTNDIAPLSGTTVTTSADAIANSYTTSGSYTATGQPSARATANTTHSIPNAAYTVVPFDVESWDTLGEFDLTTERYTATEAGTYQVNAGARLEDLSNSSLFFIAIYKNGIMYSRVLHGRNYVQGFVTRNISDMVQLAIGDYIDIRVYHNHGTARNISNAVTDTFVSIAKIH